MNCGRGSCAPLPLGKWLRLDRFLGKGAIPCLVHRLGNVHSHSPLVGYIPFASAVLGASKRRRWRHIKPVEAVNRAKVTGQHSRAYIWLPRRATSRGRVDCGFLEPNGERDKYGRCELDIELGFSILRTLRSGNLIRVGTECVNS